MATNLGFSFLTNGSVYLLNPFVGDKLIFDNSAISAAEVREFENTVQGDKKIVVFETTLDNKLAGFIVSNEVSLVLKNISSAFVKFSDGSLLKVGDNTLGTSKDDLANKLIGGVHDDHLIGLGGNDTLTGSSGNDFLEGGSGNDRLDGGAGADVFVDSQGANAFIGGDGKDVFFVQGPGNSTLDSGANTATGGAGSDTYYVPVSGLFFPIINYTVTDFVATGASHDVINISSALTQIAGSGSFYHGEDPLTGGFVRVLQSGADALVQFDFTGPDTLLGGFSTALKLTNTTASDAADRITGYRLGDGENNTLTGDGSNEFLFAAAGNDVLDGGGGADNMYGGAGNDTYHVDNGGDVVHETSNAAGQGNDTILSMVNYTLPDFVEILRLSGTVAKEADGNALDNVLNGNGQANVLKGLAGNDLLNGAAGADTLLGGDGDDRMVWGTGDLLKGEAGTDTVKIATGNLDLTTLDDSKIQAEQIDMTGGKNTLTLARSDILDLSTETNTIKVFGDAADTLDITTFHGAAVTAGAFMKYSLGGGVVLLVDPDIHVV